MKPEIKKRWVDALRSGKYQQGRINLRSSNDKFCCLGVLCDLATKDGITKWREDRLDVAYFIGSGDSTFMPHSVAEWAGLPDRNPVVVYGDEETSLVALNDHFNKSFCDIANLIEAQL